MPRNGSGQYNPLTNTWNPPVTGVLATGADFQAQLNDISAAITQSVSKDGQTPMTANLPMGNNSIVGIASGTVTTPSISANGDTNTGLYFPAADTVGVTVGGVQKAVFGTGSAVIDGMTVGKGGGAVSSNTAIGVNALDTNTTGINNTASGVGALYFNTTGINNTASGRGALYSNNTGSYNTASGVDALLYNTGSQNTASGAAALYSNTTGIYNTASGVNALYSNTTGYSNTASGLNALYSNTTYSNCGGFGYDAQVSGSNQIKIGNSATTTIVYNFQNLSDARDKTDIRDTQLGLDFIKALRPVDYRWDYREDYRPVAPKFDLQKPDESASDDEKLAYEAAEQAHKAEMLAWLEAVKPANIVRDGSKKRTRYHHGLIAQEVKAVLDEKGVDFGGFQDHSVKGGEDVLSIGYIELIAPMIKAMQEQQAIIESLTARIAALEAK